MPFEFKKIEMPDVILVVPKVFGDERGFFLEIYKQSDFEKAGIKMNLLQVNHSKSIKGVLRGLHFQKGKYAQAKLIRCIKGEIFDVAVDIRKGSPTYGRWISTELSEKNKHMIFIPKGFAHGLYTMSDEAEIEYFTDNEYNAAAESGIIWNDPVLKIKWPFQGKPILSEKDGKLPKFKEI